MVNATEMARRFNKHPVDWQRLPSTQSLLDTITEVRKSHIGNFIVISRGGNARGGTWFHRDIAIEFARWLSPAFAIWCNDRIMELLSRGSVS